jgi:hypothetical protein
LDLLNAISQLNDRKNGTIADFSLKSLSMRITANKSKLETLNATTSSPTSSAQEQAALKERERLAQAIKSDEAEVERQKARSALMWYVIWQEVMLLPSLRKNLLRMMQDWVKSQVQYSSSNVQIWSQLAIALFALEDSRDQ